jgi:hypothetical protein
MADRIKGQPHDHFNKETHVPPLMFTGEDNLLSSVDNKIKAYKEE